MAEDIKFAFRPFTREELAKIESRINEASFTSKTNVNQEAKKDDVTRIPNRALKEGMTLPLILHETFPRQLAATAIVDLDPFYSNKRTFVVISKADKIYRFTATKAVWLLDPFNPIRRIAVYVYLHPLFSKVLMCTILINCILMAVETSSSIEAAEPVFTTIYTLEFLIKLLSRGFILMPFTYLRDPWNWLDFTVIILEYLTMLVDMSVLRAIRVLRAIKAVANVSGMRTIVEAVIACIKNLRDLIIFTIISLSVLALLGLQMYQGVLSQKCIRDLPPGANETMTPDQIQDYRQNRTNWYVRTQRGEIQPLVCGTARGATQCPGGFTCLYDYGPNPNYGYTNFDSFGWALLSTFRIMIRDTWESLCQLVLRAMGPWHLLFFIFTIFLGSHYLLNLILAIVAMAYLELQKKAEQEELAEQEALLLIEELKEEEKARKEQSFSSVAASNDETSASQDLKALQEIENTDKKNENTEKNNPALQDNGALISIQDKCNNQGELLLKNDKQDTISQLLTRLDSAATEKIMSSNGGNKSFQLKRNDSKEVNFIDQMQTKPVLNSNDINELNNIITQSGRQSKASTISDAEIENGSLWQRRCAALCLKWVDTFCIWECCSCWRKCQNVLRLVVYDAFFKVFIAICIIVNTIFMALEHHEMHTELDKFLERGNIFFAITFAAEVVMKLIAISPKNYFIDPWNIFEFIVAALSLTDLIFDDLSGLPVLRSFRLLRVFKMARSWATLDLLIIIMVRSMAALADLTFVLCIIVFIFTVMGMELFGKDYEANKHKFPNEQLPRWNFTDLMHSFMVVFRVLCGQWIQTMWDCMLVSGWTCVPFFLAIVFLANLVFLNLFLVLLLSSFATSNMSDIPGDDEITEAFNRIRRFRAWIARVIRKLICRSSISINAVHPLEHKLSEDHFFQTIAAESDSTTKQVQSAASKQSHNELTEVSTDPPPSDPKRLFKRSISSNKVPVVEESNTKSGSPKEIGRTVLSAGGSQRPSLVSSNESEKGHKEITNAVQEDVDFQLNDAEATIDAQAQSARSGRIREDLGEEKIKDDKPDSQELVRDFLESVKIQAENDENEKSTNQNYTQLEDIEQENSIDKIIGKEDFNSSDETLNGIIEMDGRESKKSLDDIIGIDDLQHEKLDDKNSIIQQFEQELENKNNRDNSAEIHELTPVEYIEHEILEDVTADEQQLVEKQLDDEIAEVSMTQDEENQKHQFDTCANDGLCCPNICYNSIPWCAGRGTSSWNRWKKTRRKAMIIIENRFFNYVMIFWILLSSVALTVEDIYIKERPWLQITVYYLDIVFETVFFAEMILKWLALGFKKYFTSRWCCLDFVILVLSMISLGATLIVVSNLYTIRAMRAFRPLRAVPRVQGLHLVVNSLAEAIASIMNVLLVCLIFWLIFSIMGVTLFAGKYSACVDENGVKPNYKVVPNKTVCEGVMNYTWKRAKINFDNVGNGYLALFQVATFKGWIEVMDTAVDCRDEKDLQPVKEWNIYMYFYFVFFIIFGSFFTLKLFTTVIIDNFKRRKRMAAGNLYANMTEEQKYCHKACQRIKCKRPSRGFPKPKWKPQRIVYRIVTNKFFDITIMILIILNTVVMAMDHYKISHLFSQTLKNVNLVFLAVYTVECSLKLFAFRLYYFIQLGNVLDILVVLLSIVDVLMSTQEDRHFLSPLLLRVVKAGKLIKLLRRFTWCRGIQILLHTLAKSLSALFNIWLLHFMVLFIYAILGMHIFRNFNFVGGLDNTFNFNTFGKSIVILFQVSTSAGWDGVLEAITHDDCKYPDPKDEFDGGGICGSPGLAVVYLISYLVITFLIIINMYTAVILENYKEVREEIQEGLTDDDYDSFYETWIKYDPKCTEYIAYQELSSLFDELDPPLQISKPNKYKIAHMDIPIYTGDLLFCVDILKALTKEFFKRRGYDPQNMQKIMDEELGRDPKTQKNRFKTSSTEYRQREEYCARLLQIAIRRYWNIKTEQDPTDAIQDLRHLRRS